LQPDETTSVHRFGPIIVTMAAATDVGGRLVNADAAAIEMNPLGAAAAVVDGIGSSPAVVCAARRAADTAAVVASHRGAQAGILAAADTVPSYDGAPNAVAAVVSLEPGGLIEVAHAGDAAVYTWSAAAGLRRWTVDQTAGQHVAHTLSNPGLDNGVREVLQRYGSKVVAALDDYVLNTLGHATVSTISWTPLRGDAADPQVIVLTSDGVHKPLPAARIASLVERHHTEPVVLARALVTTAVETLTADPADNATAVVVLRARGDG
jgi:serine/threonine protein phosphatase PrpC